MNFNLSFTKHSISQMKSQDFPEQAKQNIFENFVNILEGKRYPDFIHSLPGKFKPSWHADLYSSQMGALFMKEAERYGMHHYHFGFKFYQDGKDPHYDGKVSDGIIHMAIMEKEQDMFDVKVIEICLDHPSPFKVPFHIER